MILADALVVCLRELDTRYLFGVSGANIEHIHDSVHRLGNGKFETVMTKSEFGAAFMADARARTHKTLGVCCATSGGGMMNLAVGIAESYAHAVPVLALVGQPPVAQEGRGCFQDSSGIGATVNAMAMWQAISKYTCKITAPDQFWNLFEQALLEALTQRKGPSVILLPRDMMVTEVGPIPDGFIDRIKLSIHRKPETEIGKPVLHQLIQAIEAARHPLIIMGSGIARDNAEALARSLVNKTKIPVASTLSCPNVFPNDHRQYLGMIGVAGHPSAHQYLIEKADLIISIGTQLRAMTRATLEAALTEKPLWVINDDLSEFDTLLNPDQLLQCNVTVFLKDLLGEIEPLTFQDKPTTDLPVTCIRPPYSATSLANNETENTKCNSAITPLTQSQALKIINRHLPQQGHILFDAGNCAAAAAHYLKMPLNVTTNIALGMGGMGYAIAGAIGAQLGETANKRTVVICGDGAFMMTGLEIHTAVDLGLPILWIVFNNNMHGMCVTRQQIYFDGRVEGNVYSEISIARIASGFGPHQKIWVKQVSTASELQNALELHSQFHSDKPSVIELKLQTEELPPFAPFLDQPLDTTPAWPKHTA